MVKLRGFGDQCGESYGPNNVKPIFRIPRQNICGIRFPQIPPAELGIFEFRFVKMQLGS